MTLLQRTLASAAPAALAAAFLAAPAFAAEPLKVVASFSILGDMVTVVGGDRVAVTTLVGPDGDAHVFQPTPADAKTLAGADLVVVNGLGFEGWLPRLVESVDFDGPIAVATTGISDLAAAPEEEDGHDHGGHAHEDHDDAAHGEDGHDHAAHDHDDDGHDHAAHDDGHDHAAEASEAAETDGEGHHGHDHGGFDPHAWQNLANGAVYADNIAAGLCAIDNEECDGYKANAAAYRAEILALDGEVRRRLAEVPPERRMIITSHDAFRYFSEAYGVAVVAPQGVSTDAEASAGGVARLIGQVRESGAKAIFVENIADPRLIQQIASETGAEVGGRLYSDALSPADGPAPTYLAMFRHNVELMLGAMSR